MMPAYLSVGQSRPPRAYSRLKNKSLDPAHESEADVQNTDEAFPFYTLSDQEPPQPFNDIDWFGNPFWMRRADAALKPSLFERTPQEQAKIYDAFLGLIEPPKPQYERPAIDQEGSAHWHRRPSVVLAILEDPDTSSVKARAALDELGLPPSLENEMYAYDRAYGLSSSARRRRLVREATRRLTFG